MRVAPYSLAPDYRPRGGGVTVEMPWRDALDEWARWATERTYYGPRLPSCGSIEGRYRSGQVWEVDDIRPDPPDWRVGERMERIIVSLDQRSMKVIRIWYAYRNKLKSEGILLVPDELTWAYRRAHIGSSARFLELLQESERSIEKAWTGH